MMPPHSDEELCAVVHPMIDEIAELKRALRDMRNALSFLGQFWTTPSGEPTTLHKQIEAIRKGLPVPVPETRRVILSLKSTGVASTARYEWPAHFKTKEEK